MALRKEQDELTKEKPTIEALLASEKKQWQTIAVRSATYEEIRSRHRARPSPHDVRGGARRCRRRSREAMIEREPLTIVVSQKGWIRAMKGQVADLSGATFKGDDGLKTSFFAETTSKILVLAERRQGLHARRLQAARRARAGRADPAHGRPRRERFDRRRLALFGGREDASSRRATATGSSSATTSFCPRPARAGRCSMSTAPASAALIVPAARRPCRGHRAEPQAPGVPACAAQ